jgi:hypothetical protein
MSEKIRIACLGDTMPGGILHYEDGTDFCTPELLDILKNADIRVATLETAVGDRPTFDEEKMKRDKDVIYCPTKDLTRLNTLGINVVSLANNHAWDLGLEGIEHTFRELDRLGIKYCGAGRNITEASEPAVLEVRGKTIAFIAYCDNKPVTCGYIPIATDTNPGINLMSESNIYDNVTNLKGKYDYLFVMMHWGKEYYYYPTSEVNRLARKIIDWGADGVIGSHSHQIQPTIFYHNKPIIFSLGNFFFPDRIINTPRSTYYPEEDFDLSQIPCTLGYPMVEQPTYKFWKDNARKGQIVTFIIDTQLDKSTISIQRDFTAIDNKSHLKIYNQRSPLLFRLSHYLVKFSAYGALFFFMRGCRYIRKKINGEL